MNEFELIKNQIWSEILKLSGPLVFPCIGKSPNICIWSKVRDPVGLVIWNMKHNITDKLGCDIRFRINQ